MGVLFTCDRASPINQNQFSFFTEKLMTGTLHLIYLFNGYSWLINLSTYIIILLYSVCFWYCVYMYTRFKMAPRVAT